MSEATLNRVKLTQTRNLTHREGSRSIGAYKELSSQEMELTKMYEELEQNRSVLRLLLQNCPDSVCHLLDRWLCLPPLYIMVPFVVFSCILAETDSAKDSNIISFDFFLFHQQPGDNCELAIIDLVSSGRWRIAQKQAPPMFRCWRRIGTSCWSTPSLKSLSSWSGCTSGGFTQPPSSFFSSTWLFWQLLLSSILGTSWPTIKLLLETKFLSICFWQPTVFSPSYSWPNSTLSTGQTRRRPCLSFRDLHREGITCTLSSTLSRHALPFSSSSWRTGNWLGFSSCTRAGSSWIIWPFSQGSARTYS